MKAAPKQIFTQELKPQANKAQKGFGGLQKPEAKCHKHWSKWEKMKEIKQEESNQLVFIVQEAEGQPRQPKK